MNKFSTAVSLAELTLTLSSCGMFGDDPYVGGDFAKLVQKEQEWSDTVKVVERGTVVSTTLDRSRLWASETPQAFRTKLIRRAYDAVAEAGQTVTDDAGALEFIGEKVHLVEWKKPNLKVTVAEDLVIAGELLRI